MKSTIQLLKFKRITRQPIMGVFFILITIILVSTYYMIPLAESTSLSKPEPLIKQEKFFTNTKNTEMSYFFTNANNLISCIINVPNISTTSITPFLEYIQVLGQDKTKTKIDYDNSQLQIFFKQDSNNVSTKLVHNFVKKLQNMGLRELHENKTASWFYSNNDGLEILNDSNYTPELLDFLKNEKNMFNKIIQENKKQVNYTSLIEVGCGAGENLDLAVLNNLNYLGLDFSANKIIEFNRKRSNQSTNDYQYKAECIDILDFLEAENLKRVLTNKDSKPIIIFPFNVFGNIAPISLLLSKLKIHNMDFMVSLYNNHHDTIVMREKYYKNCGYQNIMIKRDKTGVLFNSPEGLYSVAYDKLYLSNLISIFGFDVSVLESKYGFVVYAKSLKKSII